MFMVPVDARKGHQIPQEMELLGIYKPYAISFGEKNLESSETPLVPKP